MKNFVTFLMISPFFSSYKKKKEISLQKNVLCINFVSSSSLASTTFLLVRMVGEKFIKAMKNSH